MTTPLRTCCDIAQEHCDDLVLAAAYFKPNAPGRWELSGVQALAERQLLKSRATYLAERVLLAVTALEVVGIVRLFRGRRSPRSVIWRRDELLVERVALRTGRLEPGRVAIRLSVRGRSPRVELAALTHDDPTVRVLHHLGVDA
jgi:hypothetical protein